MLSWCIPRFLRSALSRQRDCDKAREIFISEDTTTPAAIPALDYNPIHLSERVENSNNKLDEVPQPPKRRTRKNRKKVHWGPTEVHLIDTAAAPYVYRYQSLPPPDSKDYHRYPHDLEIWYQLQNQRRRRKYSRSKIKPATKFDQDQTLRNMYRMVLLAEQRLEISCGHLSNALGYDAFEWMLLEEESQLRRGRMLSSSDAPRRASLTGTSSRRRGSRSASRLKRSRRSSQ